MDLMFKGRVQNIHFVGIGGIGMSGIAEVLLNMGLQVSGSDLNDTETTRRLASLAGVRPGHRVLDDLTDVVQVALTVGGACRQRLQLFELVDDEQQPGSLGGQQRLQRAQHVQPVPSPFATACARPAYGLGEGFERVCSRSDRQYPPRRLTGTQPGRQPRAHH